MSVYVVMYSTDANPTWILIKPYFFSTQEDAEFVVKTFKETRPAEHFTWVQLEVGEVDKSDPVKEEIPAPKLEVVENKEVVNAVENPPKTVIAKGYRARKKVKGR